MWRSLWVIFLISLTSVSFGITAPPKNPGDINSGDPSAGPAFEDEAGILWGNALEAFQKDHFQDVVFYLQRLVARYPSHPNHLEAHYLLGQSYLNLHQNEKAGEILKYFIQAIPHSLTSYQARIFLAESYLNQKKWQEASLVATEIREAKIKLPQQVLLQGLLVRARSSFAQGRRKEAVQVLDSILSQTRNPTPQQFILVRSQALSLQMEVQLARCDDPTDNFKTQGGALDEERIRHHFKNRSFCLMEGLNLLRDIIQLEDQTSIEASSARYGQSFRTYLAQCLKPQLWLSPKNSNKSAQEFARFSEELAQLLSKKCIKDSKNALQALDAWKQSMRESVKGLSPIMAQLSRDFQSFAQEGP
jgi:TolA-binding protein